MSLGTVQYAGVYETLQYATAPTVGDVVAYLGDDISWDNDTVAQALEAEKSDQARRCRFPLDGSGLPSYTAALTEALYRRVAHNLALRSLPLGLQASVADGAVATNYVGGIDAEVRRLEAPYRRMPVA